MKKINTKFLLAYAGGIVVYFGYQQLFEREFDFLTLSAFASATFAWFFIRHNEVPLVKPLAVVRVDNECIHIQGETFSIEDIDKVALETSEGIGYFSLPFNTINGETSYFAFEEKYFDEFERYLIGNIPNLTFIK